MVAAVVLVADGVGARADVVGSAAVGVHIDAAGFAASVYDLVCKQVN